MRGVRLARQVILVRGVRLARQVILGIPAIPDIGVRLVRLVRKVTPVRWVRLVDQRTIRTEYLNPRLVRRVVQPLTTQYLDSLQVNEPGVYSQV